MSICFSGRAFELMVFQPVYKRGGGGYKDKGIILIEKNITNNDKQFLYD